MRLVGCSSVRSLETVLFHTFRVQCLVLSVKIWAPLFIRCAGDVVEVDAEESRERLGGQGAHLAPHGGVCGAVRSHRGCCL